MGTCNQLDWGSLEGQPQVYWRSGHLTANSRDTRQTVETQAFRTSCSSATLPSFCGFTRNQALSKGRVRWVGRRICEFRLYHQVCCSLEGPKFLDLDRFGSPIALAVHIRKGKNTACLLQNCMQVYLGVSIGPVAQNRYIHVFLSWRDASLPKGL